MAVLQAPGREYDRVLETGLRPFDISRDLRAVAELISVAFATELDDRGTAALREMRVMSHFGGFLGLMNRSTGEFNDMLSGFVWVDSGRVVGNVTVQRADRAGSRWQIANVAVAPSHRGRGISKRLMEAALDHVTAARGQWAVLQVYARNTVARNLYDSLGFELVGGMADMRAPRTPHIDTSGSLPRLKTFSASDWQPLYELANHQLGAQQQWWRAVRRSEFQQSFEQSASEWLRRAIGQEQVYRRAVQESPRFEAAVVLAAQRWRGEHRIQLWTRPEHYGNYDSALLRWSLATLQTYPRWPITISLSTDHIPALEQVEFYGFRPVRTLLTMRKRVDGQEAPGALDVPGVVF
jgi:ribosomal protein S18 acetylase RimI-like enzyme